MNYNPTNIQKLLNQRIKNNSLRNLKNTFPSVDFCSNDYLGFVKTNCLSTIEINLKSGSTGSRLISGNSTETELVEKNIANFHNAQAALIFNSGYDANLGLLSSVPQKNDLILIDELCHASIYDGIRLSNAKHFKFKHNDINSLNELIQRHLTNFENIFIVVESVYSMDGDAAPLLDCVNLKNKLKNCFLIVDEAHAIGVVGENGKGLCNKLNVENECFARIYTFGKALGLHGAAIVGSNDLRNFLINFSRSFIYTTALPPTSINAIKNAYNLLNHTNQIKKLNENIIYFLTQSTKIKGIIKSYSAIQSIVLGSNLLVDNLEKKLAENNIYAKAIKSPTVKKGTERIRLCLHAFNTKNEIDLLIKILLEN